MCMPLRKLFLVLPCSSLFSPFLQGFYKVAIDRREENLVYPVAEPLDQLTRPIAIQHDDDDDQRNGRCDERYE